VGDRPGRNRGDHGAGPRESGAGQLRPIAPGQATTRDLRPDRVNVFVDASNAIVRITCG
jgi:hypothetical protein